MARQLLPLPPKLPLLSPVLERTCVRQAGDDVTDASCMTHLLHQLATCYVVEKETRLVRFFERVAGNLTHASTQMTRVG